MQEEKPPPQEEKSAYRVGCVGRWRPLLPLPSAHEKANEARRRRGWRCRQGREIERKGRRYPAWSPPREGDPAVWRRLGGNGWWGSVRFRWLERRCHEGADGVLRLRFFFLLPSQNGLRPHTPASHTAYLAFRLLFFHRHEFLWQSSTTTLAKRRRTWGKPV